MPRTASAGSGSWTGLSSEGNWSTAGNWSVSPAPGCDHAARPGSLSGNGQDAATFNGTGNGFTTITIDPNRQVGALQFATNAGSYTIGSAGANGGNALALFNVNGGGIGDTILMNSNITGSNLTETINAPILLIPFGNGNNGTFIFANNSTTPSDAIVIAGSISIGAPTTALLPLNLSGVLGGTNVISGSVGNGSGTMSIQTSGSAIWELSSANSTFTGGVFAGAQTAPASFASLATLAIGASSTGPAGAPTSGPLGTGTLFLNGGIIEAVNGSQTIANNMQSNYDSGGGPEYCITFGGSNNLTLTGTVFNSAHFFTITVNNTALTTFQGGIANTNQFFGFDGTGNSEVTGTFSTGGQALVYAGKGLPGPLWFEKLQPEHEYRFGNCDIRRDHDCEFFNRQRPGQRFHWRRICEPDLRPVHVF